MNLSNIVIRETHHNNADWDCFKTLILPEILKTQNRPQVGFCVSLAVIRLFTRVGCVRNKHQFLTAQQNLKLFLLMQIYARMEFRPRSLGFGIEVLPSSSNQAKGPREQARRDLQRNKPSSKHTNTQIKTQSQHNDLELSNVDYVSSNVKSSRSGALLYIIEDNKPVIKMIIRGRSPTMRHVSRTHRVALDWLFDRINLDPKIQIKYVDTKNQLADTMTKGNFTRDEWNHLLRLFKISIYSSASCPQTMSKRIQEGTGEEIIMAKSRPTLNLVSKTVARSSTAQSPSASNGPGTFNAPG